MPAVLSAVASGAAIGAVLRWGLSYGLNGKFALLPAGTLVANLLGGFFAGVALAYFAMHAEVSPWVRLFVVTGILGGLTTFSTFSAENVTMLLEGDYLRSLTHAAVHLFGSFAMTALGFWLVRQVA
ncbi:MAG: fluoride efflux transporter CrcB [Sutterellaceae bacterium]|nr:fluoride efflux transporter CrcB [Sutterellaceae bacterium]